MPEQMNELIREIRKLVTESKRLHQKQEEQREALERLKGQAEALKKDYDRDR